MEKNNHTISDGKYNTSKNIFSNKDSIHRFFIIGDFGDTETYENLDYVTDTMSKISSDNKIDFIATVGDNMYENGIEDIEDLDNVNKVMKAFKKPNVENLPMYLTLGNHDCYSNFGNV